MDPSGFPLEAHLFEGGTAETKTIIPVLRVARVSCGWATFRYPRRRGSVRLIKSDSRPEGSVIKKTIAKYGITGRLSR